MTGMCDNAATMLQAVPPPPDNTDNLVPLEEAAKRLDEPLARYGVRYQPGGKGLLDASEKQLYDTPDRSPRRAPGQAGLACQPPLWELGDGEWLKVVRLPGYGLRKPRQVVGVQAVLPV